MNSRSLFVVVSMLISVATTSPTLTISTTTETTIAIPAGTVVGSVTGGVEYFRGIPFAHTPTGSLRLKPPVRLETFGTVRATGIGPACPQMTALDYTPLFLEAVSNPVAATALFLGEALGGETEDCLTISVMRPEGVAPDAKMPVLFWIFGGGFELGSPQPYNASVLIPRAEEQGKPFILVAVNYRIGGFGFLGGRQIVADGSANLGLLDQRMGLEWVADNIAAFGGDPDAVTIWGESAGAISVFDQLALYDGDNTYNGRSLFRAAIMDSGSIIPAEPADGIKAQNIFDTVVHAAGCSLEADSDKLACLRSVDYETFLNATNSVPIFLSYSSPALSYMPRPDGNVLTASPYVLAKKNLYAAVPIIIGDVEDEGTLFSVFQANITTTEDLVSYLNTVLFLNATYQDIADLVDTYPYKNGSAGSPFGTGILNEEYPEFKRLAAILGDIEFTLSRRVFLDTMPSSVPAWSFLATWERGTPILGTFHTADLPRIYYGTDDASRAIQDRYIAFVTSLNPNDGVAVASTKHKTYWPIWQDSKQLIEFGANSTGIINDNFRAASFEYITSHMDILHF
ncbi:Alpha/Beta hydrolase protein [Xylariales sp. PMI_506]|nr:Alpha/Beta hydrolase protein [Xylariales sp. PMI_506]